MPIDPTRTGRAALRSGFDPTRASRGARAAYEASGFRALTVRQPYAGALIWHGKDRENRSRPMRYRGPLLIHAGLHKPDWHDFLGVRDMATRPVEWNDDRRALGVILGMVQVTGCHYASECLTAGQPPRRRYCSPWAASGQWHIEVADPVPFARAVPCRGSLVLGWRLPDDAEKAVRVQLEAGNG